ncbi:MAG: ABC transporter permease [Candidatus Lokiarchaeota archaeon]|nr:ABC transporter permease [Candidatus Lokiarchaeota archaeon]
MTKETQLELGKNIGIKKIIKEKYHSAMDRYKRQIILMLVFTIVILIIIILTIVPPFNDPEKRFWVTPDVLLDNYARPSLEHWLGTDQLGRDHLTRLIHAVRNSLGFGLLTGSMCTVIAVFLGVIGPFKGGVIDLIASFLTNIALVFPQIPFILLLSSLLQIRAWWITMLIIGLFTWPWAARSIRSQVLTIKERNFIKVSRMSALKDMRIAFFEVLPNALPYVILAFIIFLGNSIVIEAGIAMIGLGQQNSLTLGLLLNQAVEWQWISSFSYWLWLPPGICLILIYLSFFMIQSSLSKTFEQRTS